LTARSPFEKLAPMKNLVLIGLLALSFSLPARADLKIALIDTGKAFDAFYKTQQEAVRIEAKRASYQKEMQDLQAQHRNLDQDAQKLNDEIKNPATPMDVRKSDDSSLAQKVQDLQMLEKEMDQVRQTDTQEMRDELLHSHQVISDEMMKVITAYVSSKGYDLVLDKSSDSNGPASLFFYGSGRVDDLTAAIIAQLNASAPIPTPTGH
jgi:Skp family chaperone for outer membrane proteins